MLVLTIKFLGHCCRVDVHFDVLAQTLLLPSIVHQESQTSLWQKG